MYHLNSMMTTKPDFASPPNQCPTDNTQSSSSSSPPSLPPPPSPLDNLVQWANTLYNRLRTNQRDQVFLLLTTGLLLFFNVLLAELTITIRYWLLNGALVYVAWTLTPWLYASAPWIEKKLIDSSGKAVLITGCDTGFGHQLAKRLVAKGYYVFAGCLSANSSGAQQLRSHYRTDDQLLVVPLDVTSDESVVNAKKIVEEKLSQLSSGNSKKYSTQTQSDNFHLWALVNNAGILSLLAIEFGDMTEYLRQMEVNCMGTVRVTKAFVPLLRRNHSSGVGEGRVVNMASLAGRFTMPGFVAYCMSKGAVIMFTDGLRRELRKWNIDVVCIEPHLYRTNLVNREQINKVYDEGWRQTPEDIRTDYGEEYFTRFQRTMETALTTARDSVEQVVQTMEQACTWQTIETHYQVMRHVERLRLWFFQSLAPTPLVDYLMCKALVDGNGTPVALVAAAKQRQNLQQRQRQLKKKR